MGLIFLGIVDFNNWVEDVLFLTLGCLAQDLFGGDLYGRRSAIFDTSLIALGGHHGAAVFILWRGIGADWCGFQTSACDGQAYS